MSAGTLLITPVHPAATGMIGTRGSNPAKRPWRSNEPLKASDHEPGVATKTGASRCALPGQNDLDGTGVGRPGEDIVGLHHFVEAKMVSAELTDIDLAGSNQAQQRWR